jgi:transposase
MYTQIHIRKIKDIDSGGRPTSIDNPILLKSIINNVGFKIGTDEAINKTVIEQLNLPF